MYPLSPQGVYKRVFGSCKDVVMGWLDILFGKGSGMMAYQFRINLGIMVWCMGVMLKTFT